ncbi:MAG TPA: diacylglycerol kinase family protein [Streptosporangiaceae bacterium]|nr:diacylglycerol kinase family protein [Streptosporangiaceae bacterium]
MVFVINRALVRDPRRFGRRCRAAARAFGWEPVLAETSPGESGLRLARQAVADGAGLVFAAGGDGTVRACAQALAGTGIPLAIVPLGTANLTARALGLPTRADRAIEAGFRGRDRRIDLALADVGGADEGSADGGGTGESSAAAKGTNQDSAGGIMFAAMAGIGLDAAVVSAAHAQDKRRLGWVAYAASGLTHLWLPAREFTVRLDGGEPLARRARCVVVGNAGLLPGGFVLLPEARCDDGWLDVGILAPSGVLGWPRVAGLVLTHSRRQDGQLERFRARRVEISAAIDLPRQVDGEVIAPGRSLDVSVRPGALTVRQGR